MPNTTNDKPEARDFYIGDEVRLASPFTGKDVVKIEWGCRGFIYYTPPTSIGGHALPSPAGAWEHLDGAPLARFVGISEEHSFADPAMYQDYKNAPRLIRLDAVNAILGVTEER